MIRKAIISSTALTLALAPVAAQAAPAARTESAVQQADELRGPTKWIVYAIALGLIVWGAIEIFDDEPESP
jgi:hypothetical protein